MPVAPLAASNTRCHPRARNYRRCWIGSVRDFRDQSRMQLERYDYDTRHLGVGDPVEVFIEPERRWQRGTFGISTAGTAFVEIGGRVQFRFEQALLMGLRRIANGDASAR